MTDWVVSQSDVEKHPKYGKASLDDILYDYGMEISKGYESNGRDKQEVDENVEEEHFGFTHRSTFTGEIHTCPQYSGEARTDGKWKRFTENFVAV